MQIFSLRYFVLCIAAADTEYFRRFFLVPLRKKNNYWVFNLRISRDHFTLTQFMKIDNFVKNDYDFLILLLNFNKFLFAHFLSVRDNVSSLFKIK